MKHFCKFCQKEFLTGQKVGGHQVRCSLNPKREELKKKMSESMRGEKNPSKRKDVREKISATVRKRIINDTWHNSFSKQRSVEYAGEKFHGNWEVEYAKWLDSKNIKWRRCTEKFPYHFEEKQRWYTPDFYIESENKYVEIKGCPTSKDEAKWNQFPLRLEIVNGKDLFDLGLIKSFRTIDFSYKNKNWRVS